MIYPWLLPLFSGMCDAGSRLVIKTSRIHNLTLISGGYLFALPFYAVWMVFEGIPTIGALFWKTLAVHVPLLLIANVLMVEAHRRAPLIITVPYLSFTPAFLLVTSPIMGMAKPTWWGGLGGADSDIRALSPEYPL